MIFLGPSHNTDTYIAGGMGEGSYRIVRSVPSVSPFSRHILARLTSPSINQNTGFITMSSNTRYLMANKAIFVFGSGIVSVKEREL